MSSYERSNARIRNMKRKYTYRGCELESPIYRQVAEEMAKARGEEIVTEYKTKRGKRNGGK